MGSFVFLYAAAVSAAGPAVTPQQIEADWLRQDELRAQSPSAHGTLPAIKVEEDAAGGVDGLITGEWGFHTENEKDPWWQVDLGNGAAIDRVVLYNRCDGCGARNVRIILWLSDDGKNFRQVYQHDGTIFYGKTDGKPLVAKLNGQQGRYLRLGLTGTSYFHLDEVQVFAPGQDQNIALGRPATQSSLSEWSKPHGKPPLTAAGQIARTYPAPRVIEQGRKLADDLRARGGAVDAHVQTLSQIAEQWSQLPADAPDATQRQLYLQARWTVRKLTLTNPLLDFDQIVFVKRAPTLLPHVSDQYYGWFSRGGGGVYVLSGFRGDNPQLRCLTEQFSVGNFVLPEISYDGRKLLFGYCKYYPELAGKGDKTKKEEIAEDAFYHIFEMHVDGTGLRQLTQGRYDDFGARYLPSGEIVFLSTRKGTALQVGKESATATCLNSKLPDSYVRCGGGRSRPVAVFTLHKMDTQGGNLQPISAFENFEWPPTVDEDGRVIYARWDYIDRFNGNFFSLWATNPDGTNAQLIYKNYTVRPQCAFEARPIPNSHKLVFTGSAHHSIDGGSLALLDRTKGTEFEGPLTRLTPEVCFPETEGWPNAYYGGPWPLSEEHFLCSWADKPLPPHTQTSVDDPRNPPNASGIYLVDAFGNLNLLHRDSDISSTNPIAVKPRPQPPQIADLVEANAPQEGRFLVQNIYEGLGGIERGSIARLRIVAVVPKVQPEMNSPVIGVSAEDTGKFVLGTVPVEPDGSAYFRVPSGMPYFFQALDRDGYAVQTMRSLTYVQPNTTLGCIGCHESRDYTPLRGRMPLALAREPSRVKPDAEGSWPLRYDQLVQPVLDKHCVSCHRPDAQEPEGAKFDLTAAVSYAALLHYASDDLKKLALEKDFSVVGDMPARKSKLMALLMAGQGHKDVKLDADSRQRLATWMDTYATRQGAFSTQQEEELRQFKVRMAHLLEPQ
ncbi:MAG: discoidin domain-containing protein [Planctomycetota bacterium]|nr:discoidin domain-containing protein [Planctomycetota bacterium]